MTHDDPNDHLWSCLVTALNMLPQHDSTVVFAQFMADLDEHPVTEQIRADLQLFAQIRTAFCAGYLAIQWIREMLRWTPEAGWTWSPPKLVARNRGH